LAALATLLRAQPEPPLLISDECHRGVLLPSEQFVQPGAHYERTCIVYSLGKSLLMQGQRFGYIAVSPTDPLREELSQHLEQLTRVMGFCTPTSIMQLAVGGLLHLKPPMERFQARRERLLDAFAGVGIQCQASQATFFLYPVVPSDDDAAFATRLAREGVLVLPSSVFHHEGHFRVCLTATDSMVDRSIDVLRRLERTQWN
jgi:aspartate aminotransferase